MFSHAENAGAAEFVLTQSVWRTSPARDGGPISPVGSTQSSQSTNAGFPSLARESGNKLVYVVASTADSVSEQLLRGLLIVFDAELLDGLDLLVNVVIEAIGYGTFDESANAVAIFQHPVHLEIKDQNMQISLPFPIKNPPLE